MRPMVLVVARNHAKRLLSTTSLKMTAGNDDYSTPHVVRTAHEPRQAGTWHATVNKIDQVNSTVRCLRLTLAKDEHPPPRPLPGQYIDLHIPGIPTVGGFTITSPPQTALPVGNTATTATAKATATAAAPYIELAIQKSPNNPPAAYLWQPASTILNSGVSFQVGGRFTFPPGTDTLSEEEIAATENVVFIAGGVGINPIMSMISAMDAGGGDIGRRVRRVRVLYSSRRCGIHNDSNNNSTPPRPEKILFEDRLVAVAKKWKAKPDIDYEYTLFETGSGLAGVEAEKEEVEERGQDEGGQPPVYRVRRRRIGHHDLLAALGPESEWAKTLVYVCGVPQMTDEFTDFLRKQKGLEDKRVLCEKWW